MTETLPPVFLSNTSANNIETRHILLVRGQPSSIHYLVNNTNDSLSTSPTLNDLHSTLRVRKYGARLGCLPNQCQTEVFPAYLLLTVWDNVIVTVADVAIPVSSPQEIKSFILLDKMSFIAPSGRWEVEFDHDCSISNSMRRLPHPIVKEDTGITNVNLTDLLVDATRMVDDEKGKEALTHKAEFVKILPEENEPENQLPVSPRATLSQLDGLDFTSPTSSVQPDRHKEIPTQQLPHVENLAQLRKIATDQADHASERRRVQFTAPNSRTEVTLQPELDLRSEKLSSATVQRFAEGYQYATPEAETHPATFVPAQSAQEFADSDGTVGDDKIMASETESGREDNIGNKDEGTSKVSQNPDRDARIQAKESLSMQMPMNNASDNEISPRPKKRRRMIPVAASSPAHEDSGVASSPPRKRVRKSTQLEADISASEPASTQKNIRWRVKDPTKFGTIDFKPEESGTMTAITDHTRTRPVRQTRSASVDQKPQKLPTKPKIVLSTSISDLNTREHEKKLKALGAIVGNDVIAADIFCVPDGELKKTLKSVLAIIHGKLIVTEEWLRECSRAGTFVDPVGYLPDQGTDTSWTLAKALDSGRNNTTTRLLAFWSVFITKQLEKELGQSRVKEQAQIAKAMGAYFHTRLPSERAVKNVLVLGSNDDSYASTVSKLGHSLFRREILTMAALRGTLDMASDEFRVQVIKTENSD